MGRAGGSWKLVLEGRDRGGLGKFQKDLWNHQLAEQSPSNPLFYHPSRQILIFHQPGFSSNKAICGKKIQFPTTYPTHFWGASLPYPFVGAVYSLQSGSVPQTKKIHQGSTQRQARSPNRQIAGNDNDSQFGTWKYGWAPRWMYCTDSLKLTASSPKEILGRLPQKERKVFRVHPFLGDMLMILKGQLGIITHFHTHYVGLMFWDFPFRGMLGSRYIQLSPEVQVVY